MVERECEYCCSTGEIDADPLALGEPVQTEPCPRCGGTAWVDDSTLKSDDPNRLILGGDNDVSSN